MKMWGIIIKQYVWSRNLIYPLCGRTYYCDIQVMWTSFITLVICLRDYMCVQELEEMGFKNYAQ